MIRNIKLNKYIYFNIYSIFNRDSFEMGFSERHN